MSMRAGEAGYGDDDRLPWLETVEEDYRDGPSVGRILLLIILALLVLGAAAFGYYWYDKQQGLAGNGELINAQEGDYKVKPDEPGGNVADGEGQAVYEIGRGVQSNASINLDALPEAPVEGTTASKGPPQAGTKTAKLPVPSGAGAPTTRPRVPATQPPAANTGSGALIQLGAFPDEQGATAAWNRLSKRFAYLAPLGQSVERGESGGKTVYRLRVNAGSNGQAKELCGRLKVAGESCYVAN